MKKNALWLLIPLCTGSLLIAAANDGTNGGRLSGSESEDEQAYNAPLIEYDQNGLAIVHDYAPGSNDQHDQDFALVRSPGHANLEERYGPLGSEGLNLYRQYLEQSRIQPHPTAEDEPEELQAEDIRESDSDEGI